MTDEDKVLSFLGNRLSVLPDLAESYTTDRALGVKKPHRALFENTRKKIGDFIKSGASEEARRIIIMPGLRGVGKTTLLFQLYDSLSPMAGRNNILYADCSDLKANGIGLNDFIAAYEKRIIGEPFERTKKRVVIMVDETHAEPGWEAVVKSLNNRSKNIFFVLTGSSSLALEGSADLARRSETNWLFPLVFCEYVMLKSAKGGRAITPPPGIGKKLQEIIFSGMPAKDCLPRLEAIDKLLTREYFSSIPLMEMEQERYMCNGGFPFIMHEERESMAFQGIIDVTKRVIEADLPLFTSLGRRSMPAVMPILQMLSAGVDKVSYESMGASIGLAKSRVSDILKSLEKAGVIFGVKPIGNAERIAGSSWKHYFSTPSLRAALLWSIGKFDGSSKTLGFLLETHVADALYRIKAQGGRITDFFFLPGSGDADFIVKSRGCEIAVECGWGTKDSVQVRRTMKSYGAGKGIVISRAELKYEGGVLFMPLRLFLMV